MTERRVLSGRIHVHLGKGVSLSLPVGEIVDSARQVVGSVFRRVVVAVSHPRVGRNVKARIADDEMERIAEEERDKILMDTEKTLTGLGYPKAQARAAIEQIRPAAIHKKSHEIVTMALRAAKPPAGTEVVESHGKEPGQTRESS